MADLATLFWLQSLSSRPGTLPPAPDLESLESENFSQLQLVPAATWMGRAWHGAWLLEVRTQQRPFPFYRWCHSEPELTACSNLWPAFASSVTLDQVLESGKQVSASVRGKDRGWCELGRR